MSREYQHGNIYDDHGNVHGHVSVEQIAICTSDQECKAAADEHNADCPVEQQLLDELGF